MTLLKNKVAIVTGASSGIGAAIAEKFAEEGAKVTMVGRNKDKLENVAKKLKAKGSQPLVLVGDVTNEHQCRQIVGETLKYFGKLDVLVNNAGILKGKSILDEKVMEEFDEVMSTNLRSAVFMTHLAAPHLIETKGNIINISSVTGRTTFPTAVVPSAYSVSKAALDHFTRCNALELSEKGVRVNAINPGPVGSDLYAAAADPAAVLERMRGATALGRTSDAEEIADLAVFLASEKARGMTGGTYVSDNGVLLSN